MSGMIKKYIWWVVLPVVLLSVAGLIIALYGHFDGETLSGPVAVIRGSTPKHGYLGVSFSSTPGQELTLQTVLKGSGAALSGMKPCDVVISVDGQLISKASEVQRLCAAKSPGDIVVIRVRRTTGELTLRPRLINVEQMVTLQAEPQH